MPCSGLISMISFLAFAAPCPVTRLVLADACAWFGEHGAMDRPSVASHAGHGRRSLGLGVPPRSQRRLPGDLARASFRMSYNWYYVK